MGYEYATNRQVCNFHALSVNSNKKARKEHIQADFVRKLWVFWGGPERTRTADFYNANYTVRGPQVSRRTHFVPKIRTLARIMPTHIRRCATVWLHSWLHWMGYSTSFSRS